MNPQQRQAKRRIENAIDDSIAHWLIMASDGISDEHKPAGADCPLCDVFFTPSLSFESWCSGCPVKESTKKEQCDGTPFYPARDAVLYGTKNRRHIACLDEVMFLARLRFSIPQASINYLVEKDG